MTVGERCLVVAVLALVLSLLAVRMVGEWINGGWHALRHHARRLRHRWNHRNCRKPKDRAPDRPKS